MKFKVSPSLSKRSFAVSVPKGKIFRLKGASTLRNFKCKALVRNTWADEFGEFEKEDGKRKKSRKKREARISTASLLGAFYGTLSVCVISALLLTASLFLRYGGPYKEVKIPDLLSLSAEQAVSVAPDIFEYEITYRRNPDKKDGCVISQTPLPDVTRRLYGSSNKIKIKLSVNTPENTLTLPDLSGTSLRDALILLKSVGANVNIREEYSNTVGYGKIISSSLPQGTLVKDGDVITLSASLGKETLYVSVPDLSGLNENQALALLRSKNLEIGEIKYQSSKMPIGTVISQSIANGTSLPEKSKISFTVSGGIYY